MAGRLYPNLSARPSISTHTSLAAASDSATGSGRSSTGDPLATMADQRALIAAGTRPRSTSRVVKGSILASECNYTVRVSRPHGPQCAMAAGECVRKTGIKGWAVHVGMMPPLPGESILALGQPQAKRQRRTVLQRQPPLMEVDESLHPQDYVSTAAAVTAIAASSAVATAMTSTTGATSSSRSSSVDSAIEIGDTSPLVTRHPGRGRSGSNPPLSPLTSLGDSVDSALSQAPVRTPSAAAKMAAIPSKAVVMSKSDNHRVMHKRGRCQIIPECYLNIHKEETEETEETDDEGLQSKRHYERNHRASYEGRVGSTAGYFK